MKWFTLILSTLFLAAAVHSFLTAAEENQLIALLQKISADSGE